MDRILRAGIELQGGVVDGFSLVGAAEFLRVDLTHQQVQLDCFARLAHERDVQLVRLDQQLPLVERPQQPLEVLHGGDILRVDLKHAFMRIGR